MLARKYDNYAWEEIEYERPVERVRKSQKKLTINLCVAVLPC